MQGEFAQVNRQLAASQARNGAAGGRGMNKAEMHVAEMRDCVTTLSAQSVRQRERIAELEERLAVSQESAATLREALTGAAWLIQEFSSRVRNYRPSPEDARKCGHYGRLIEAALATPGKGEA